MSAPVTLDPALLAWIVESLVASALLMAIVLLARAPVRRAFGPQVAYALWALPALRLLLPPLPGEWREQVAMPIAAAGEAVGVLILPADATAMAVEAPGLPWGAIALAAWGLGTLAFFLFHVANHRRFCARLLRDARLVDEVEGIRVIESAAATGPLAFGTLRRFVAFPHDFTERYDADEREFALLHELGHHRARDLLSNWVALAVLALHWFNPLAWHAFRLFRCDQELANDARVLAGRSRTDAHVYACAILKAAHGGHVSAACHLHTIADLKGRMRMLTRSRPSRRRLAAGTTAVAALVATGLGLTASGTRAAAAVSTRIGDAVGVDLAAQAVPAAPAAPASPTAPATPSIPVAPEKPATTAKRVQRVIVTKNGETRTYEGAAAEAYTAANPLPPLPPLPPTALRSDEPLILTAKRGEVLRLRSGRDTPFTMVLPGQVVSRTCTDGKDGDPKRFVLHSEENGRRITIICRNRIDKVASQADARQMADHARAMAAHVRDIAGNARVQAAMAQLAARDARHDAYRGIQSARAGIVADRNLSDEQRRNALAGLDKAQAELSSRD